MPPGQLHHRAASAWGSDRADADEVVMLRRSAVAPCVTCGLCGGILRDATTVSECLHSFCRKCIFKKFEDEDTTFCPTCSTDLGCDPLEKLRTDHSLLCIRLMLFPVKRRKFENIPLPHPALVSQPLHLPQIHGVGQSAKKSDAFFMRKSMNGEAKAEVVESPSARAPASPEPDVDPQNPPSPIQMISSDESIVSSPRYSFALEDLIVEKGSEATSSRPLTTDHQPKLQKLFSLLQRDIQDQVQNADLVGEILDFDKDLPSDVKASLEPVSKLDNHFAAVKQALKNQSVKPALEQRRNEVKQSLKNLHSQVQNNSILLTSLQASLESKKSRKAALKAELRDLSAEIEADEQKMAGLPESNDQVKKEALSIVKEYKQLKMRLSILSKTQEADQKLLESINKTISDAMAVVSKYLDA